MITSQGALTYHSDENPFAESNFSDESLVVHAVASMHGSSSSSQSPAYVPEVTHGVWAVIRTAGRRISHRALKTRSGLTHSHMGVGLLAQT